MPSLPAEVLKAKGHKNLGEYEAMKDIKLVIDYGNLTYTEALDLPVDTFRLMLKNAFIDRMNETEEGRKYLDDCERFKQDKPDISAIRKKINS